jgi:tol-pal system protein YbgF
MKQNFRSRWPMALLSGFGLVVAVAGAWAAQDPKPHAIVRQLDAAEVQSRGMENGMAPANRQPGTYRVAQLFGESDEEKAARLAAQQHEQSQDSSLNWLRQRNDDLENTMRRLTGQIEQLDHRITELNGRMERMQKDFDYKLCALSAQQLGASAGGGEENALPCNDAATQSAPPPAAASAPVAPAGRAAGGEPMRLGMPAAGAAKPAVEPIRPAAPTVLGNVPPGGGRSEMPGPSANRAKFDAAMRLLAKAQYDEARSAFRSFADSYPQDELTPQAVYWIGDIAYVQKDYANAARAFAEEIKRYPASSRAPESMLKLGQSLIAMGQKQEGCTALAALPSKYPGASKAIVDRAAQSRKSSGCR